MWSFNIKKALLFTSDSNETIYLDWRKIWNEYHYKKKKEFALINTPVHTHH